MEVEKRAPRIRKKIHKHRKITQADKKVMRRAGKACRLVGDLDEEI